LLNADAAAEGNEEEAAAETEEVNTFDKIWADNELLQDPYWQHRLRSIGADAIETSFDGMYWSETQLDTLNSTSILLDPLARGPQILALQRPNSVQCLGQAVDEEEFAYSLGYGAAVIDPSGAEVRGGQAFLVDNFDWQE